MIFLFLLKNYFTGCSGTPRRLRNEMISLLLLDRQAVQIVVPRAKLTGGDGEGTAINGGGRGGGSRILSLTSSLAVASAAARAGLWSDTQ